MRCLALVASVTVAAAVTAVPVISQSPAAPGSWMEKARVGEQRTEAGVAAANGRIYVIGGMSRGKDSDTLNQEYDPATDRWRERAPMPSPLSHPGAAELNGRIYVVGGFLRNVHLDAQDLVYEYDPAKDTWRKLASLKSPRGSVGVVALNGKIHAIAGRDPNRDTVGTHEVYDPAAGKWSELAPLPQPRDHVAAVAAQGRIHIIGGRFYTPVENTNMHDVYNPATNTWTTAAPLMTPRSGGAGVLHRNRILVFGGECDNRIPFAHNEAFDLKTGRWSALAPMPSGRHGIMGAAIGPAVYIPGGAPMCATAASDTLLVFRG